MEVERTRVREGKGKRSPQKLCQDYGPCRQFSPSWERGPGLLPLACPSLALPLFWSSEPSASPFPLGPCRRKAETGLRLEHRESRQEDILGSAGDGRSPSSRDNSAQTSKSQGTPPALQKLSGGGSVTWLLLGIPLHTSTTTSQGIIGCANISLCAGEKEMGHPLAGLTFPTTPSFSTLL